MQVLVDTKKEYTKYIQDSIAISIAEKINNYYDDSVKQGLGMKGFQNNLNNIKKWDNNILEIEYNNLLAKSKYKNLEKIYNFTINTYIKLRLIEQNLEDDNFSYEVPSILNFIHNCYINVAIWAWKNPFVFFKNNLKQLEIQNNYNIIEKNIKKIIKNTLRECVPIDKIITNTKQNNNIIKNIKKYDSSNLQLIKEVPENNHVTKKNSFIDNFMIFAKNTIYKENNISTFSNNKTLLDNTKESEKVKFHDKYDKVDMSDEVEQLDEEAEDLQSEAEEEQTDAEEAEEAEDLQSEAEDLQSEAEEEQTDAEESEAEEAEESEAEEEEVSEADEAEESEVSDVSDVSDVSEVSKSSHDSDISLRVETNKNTSNKSKIIKNANKQNKFINDTSSSDDNSDDDISNNKKVIWKKVR
jgi:hypothetical protein